MRCLGIREFAALCGVSVRTLEREKAEGKLPPHRTIRSRHVWTEDDVAAYCRALPRFDAVGQGSGR